jgi:magnesium-transporting ATPase (P-type)
VTRPPTRPGLRAAPWLLWFGVLGGALAWTAHTLVDWGIDETTCRAGSTELDGASLRSVLVATTLAFLLVSAVATVVAWRQWHVLRATEGADPLSQLRLQRAGFMALVGFAANVVFTLILVCTATAVFVFPVCGS